MSKCPNHLPGTNCNILDPINYCGPEPCNTERIDNLAEALKPVDLSNCATHCWELMRSFPGDTKGFTRTDLHYEATGLELTYLCNTDGRKYSVFIQPVGK